MAERQLYAGIDLGSNSFHMIVARLEHGQMRVIDRLKDMVRLAGGLDEQGRLDAETRQRGLEALARFGDRIRDIPESQVRAVGTQTFRRLSHPAGFLVPAETALGFPIDIVSGREEARLVWLGVSQGVAPVEGRRLVIDIGGGSTELVAGQALQPDLAESLPLGCVSLTREFHGTGRLDATSHEHALERCRAELQGWERQFRNYGCQQAIGSSGTIRAIAEMIEAHDPAEAGRIRPGPLRQLRLRLLEHGRIEDLQHPGLSERRRPVIMGGLAILESVIETLGIEQVSVSPYALREGLLQDLYGRLTHQDPRDATIRAMEARYQIDHDQAARVTDWTAAAFEQLCANWALRPIHGDMLHWISRLHEIGLAVAHDGHQRHTAYILEHADMPGFSRQEQQFMAVIASQQRRGIQESEFDRLPGRLQQPARRLTALLRLAVTVCRSRTESAFGDFSLTAEGSELRLGLDPAWLSARPLIRHDLETEAEELERIGIELRLSDLPLPQAR
ncbi:Ppx/GppA phosphatase family protein [Wenzhouxiangella marina]|uniref:Exopolyphosphatase n=1 Tax=Wenzhouxiangella marina TaxID=1579979 RepID=A0A0K0XXI6_9GAMM|nr:Ppx/GppA phosphatase family protein [Wenzhouxiangella marina]AKS42398.1 Exopolyphosphatase [Wenzhouxiangella marina]MBB6085828.1 exopolyphosphatase/guanosine-5'-triphosphate,3'-diphosphate pyrophosphatase [Wenzhouxiangella marina]